MHECECDEGWSGEACNQPECPGGDNPCSNNGVCLDQLSPPRCVCDAGFFGDACEHALRNNSVCALGDCVRFSCPDLSFELPPDDDPDSCGDFHRQNIMFVISEEEIWDSRYCGGAEQECNGHGFCDADSKKCVCREGFSAGISGECQDAACEGLCGENGFCNLDLAEPKCDCDPFFFGENCEFNNIPCPAILDPLSSEGALLECSMNGVCVNGTCDCDDGFSGPDCSIGNCTVGDNGFQCSNHGRCQRTNSTEWDCICGATWEGADCGEAVCAADDAGNECSGLGTCRLNGTVNACFCNSGRTGEYCQTEAEKDGDDSDEIGWFVWLALVIVVLLILIVLSVIGAALLIVIIKKRIAGDNSEGAVTF
eukprot:TRINITY_DN3104_c0_g1_i5.p1 TRINITY_DN3104_c0_g1~~TRINITY_DN3104_c0_g1_i5.p1  ORF type:complete len:368 (-),score=70.83 TRINITY_DN3104_c0_g1_i5:203-1306(-)